jgi:hypothetical protein
LIRHDGDSLFQGLDPLGQKFDATDGHGTHKEGQDQCKKDESGEGKNEAVTESWSKEPGGDQKEATEATEEGAEDGYISHDLACGIVVACFGRFAQICSV